MINNNQLTVPCVGSVKQGDSVMIITRNGEPVAVAPIGWGDAVESDISDAATKATSYITDISNAGIMVHPSDDSTTGVSIDGDSVDIKREGTTVATFEENEVSLGIVPSSTQNSYVKMMGDTFVIESGLLLPSGNRTTLSVPASAGTYQALSLATGALGHLNMQSMGNSVLTGVTSLSMSTLDTNGYPVGVFVDTNGNTDAATVKLAGHKIELDGSVTCDAVNGLYARATGTSSAANYFTLINADTGVGVQFIFNPSTRNLAVRYTTNGGTNWSSTKALISWS